MKRGQDQQGGEERYGPMGGQETMNPDEGRPKQATAAQMAKRKIAQARSHSNRSSRASTPTGNAFSSQTQSMPSFQPPSQTGGGFGSGFNFTASAASNPFEAQNGTTGATPSFSFGSAGQQNAAAPSFGSNGVSFGSTFGSTNASQQPPSQTQNGFGQSSNGLFGQNSASTAASTPTFGSFGQKPLQNGSTSGGATQENGNPFKGFGASQPSTQAAQTSSFGGFGKSSEANGDKPAAPTFTFGQSQSQTNGHTSLFGSGGNATELPKPTAPPISFNFGDSSKQNGETAPVFGAPASQTEQTSKPATSNLFGAAQNPTPATSSLFGAGQTPKTTATFSFGTQPDGDKPLFGATSQQDTSKTPNLGKSIFSSMNQPKTSGISSSMFTDAAKNAVPEKDDEDAATEEEQTPKPTNLFAGFGQPKANGLSSNAEQTSKPTTNLFGGFSDQSQPTNTAFNPFGQDTNMNSTASTPQKQQPSAPAAAPSETPAQPGKSLFDRVSRDPPATAQKPADTPAKPVFQFDSSAPSKPAFTPSTNLFNKPAEAQTSSTDFFGGKTPSAHVASAAAPLAKSAGSVSTQATTMNETISQSERATFQTLNESLKKHLGTQNPSADWTSICEYYLKEATKIRKKPEPKSAAAAEESSSTPYSSAAASSNAAEAPKPSAPSNLFGGMSSSKATASATNVFGAAASKAPAPTANLFAPATDRTPASASNLFGSTDAAKAPSSAAALFSSTAPPATPKPSTTAQQPPATAPVNRKRAFEADESEPVPATDKRARHQDPTPYPSLPEGASSTSKWLAGALAQPGLSSSTSGPQKETPVTPAFAPTASSAKSVSTGFTPSTTGFKSATFGFTLATEGSKPSTTGFTPSVSSGPPVFGTGASNGNSFASAFAKKASEQEEKDRQKRMDEDYDSDEESKEAWAARDKVEQEAKRQKILEAAKNAKGFVLPDTASKGTTAETEKDKSTESSAAKSLFDRVTPKSPTKVNGGLFGSQTPSAAKTGSTSNNLFGTSTPAFGGASASSNIFGNAASATDSNASKVAEKDVGEVVEKVTQGTGDNTWNVKTPIKFGASTTTGTESTTPAALPPAFGNLFGSSSSKPATNSTGHLNVPPASAIKPAFGFNFGAQSTSRATTPGLTTDGEGTGVSNAGDAENDAGEDATPPEIQVEDQTGLHPDELENEDLVFSVHMAKAMKWAERKDGEAGEMTHGWVDVGKGPLYVLRNKATGMTRVVLKIPPYGKPRMNFPLLKNCKYEVQGGAGKMVSGPFVDHFAMESLKKAGADVAAALRPGKWLIQVGKAADAKKMAEVMTEEAAKQS